MMVMAMTRIDQFSLTTAPIEQYFNDTKLGVATGFVWQVGNQPYLVTNWHVVTCQRFPTGENLHSQSGRPNVLRVHFNIRAQDFGKKRFDITIRDGDNKPLWLIRPGRNVDIAVVPLPIDPNDPVVNLHSLNKLTTTDIGVFIGLDVFVLGYPFGLEPPGYPVWKRGSIASEPDLVRMTYDYLLVDTAPRPGMSGGPVILRNSSNHITEDGSNRPLDSTPRTRFIGIYSGCVQTKDKEEAQIGMVWHPSFIEEIIAANTRDPGRRILTLRYQQARARSRCVPPCQPELEVVHGDADRAGEALQQPIAPRQLVALLSSEAAQPLRKFGVADQMVGIRSGGYGDDHRVYGIVVRKYGSNIQSRAEIGARASTVLSLVSFRHHVVEKPRPRRVGFKQGPAQ